MRLAPVALLVFALAGCPRFHGEPLSGAPAGATFVDVDGVHVHYRESGKGPAVVLLHGYGASLEAWNGVAAALAPSHRVIAIDLKGFGWTSRPDGDYSPAAQAQLVWHVLDKLGVQDVAIVGHSWGTSVGLSMAVAQPTRTRKVALYDAYVYDEQVPSFFRWAQKAGIGELLFALFYTERIEDRAPLAYYDEGWVTQARIERVENDMRKPGTVAAALATARGHHFRELHDKLQTFDRPVLLLWGENDEVTPMAFGRRLANDLPNAELKTYPRCGHIPMVEARSQSTRDLVAFLAETNHDDAEQRGTGSGGDATGRPSGGSDDDRDQPRGPGGGEAGSGAGGEGGGGGGGGASGSVSTTVAGDAAMTERQQQVDGETLVDLVPQMGGGDLAALGVELTPRLYAAPREKTQVVLHGAFRLRESGLYNLDLDRGLDSMGQPLFKVPLSGGQFLDAGDMRARTDVAVYARGVGVAVKARIDWLDNVAIGGSPDLAGGSPATSGGQRPTTVVIKRAWGEALTPVGTLAVGRMGAHFGLGMAANGGDCEDCDHGDAADRMAFVTPLFGHLLAVAYDFTSRGPFTPGRDKGHPVELEASTVVSGPTVGILKVHSPATLARRAAAGLTSFEYAGYVTHRAQENDIPSTYLPVAAPANFTSADLVARGFSATGTGAWLRIIGARFRVEGEVSFLEARVAQPSLIPGTEITIPVTSKQLGAALQSEVLAGPTRLGFDAGYASGDDAPGFGAFPAPGQTAPMPGAFDGPQADLPRDRTVDNFRFHPDFRIDQILFREIIGTVTDAIYVRPHFRATLMKVGSGKLETIAAVIASWAVERTSTPSGQRALGVELDPELRYAHKDGFAINFAYGLLFPGAAFDGSALPAKPAQCFRLRMGFAF
jgi:uncharacterized protein (TIGR04551 family)